MKEIQAAGCIQSYWISFCIHASCVFRKVFLNLWKLMKVKWQNHMSQFQNPADYHLCSRISSWASKNQELRVHSIPSRVYICRISCNVYFEMACVHVKVNFLYTMMVFLNCIASDLDFFRFMQEIRIYSRWSTIYLTLKAECKRTK